MLTFFSVLVYFFISSNLSLIITWVTPYFFIFSLYLFKKYVIKLFVFFFFFGIGNYLEEENPEEKNDVLNRISDDLDYLLNTNTTDRNHNPDDETHTSL